MDLSQAEGKVTTYLLRNRNNFTVDIINCQKMMMNDGHIDDEDEDKNSGVLPHYMNTS